MLTSFQVLIIGNVWLNMLWNLTTGLFGKSYSRHDYKHPLK